MTEEALPENRCLLHQRLPQNGGYRKICRPSSPPIRPCPTLERNAVAQRSTDIGDADSFANRAAKDLGITIRLNAAVDHIDFEGPSVTIKGGETLNCDVVIGADGLNSVTKEILLGRKVPPHPTGDLAYRHTIREEDMRKHAILHELIDSVTNDIWMGPDTFVVGYLLKEGGFYNIVLVSPDTLPDTVDAFKATPQVGSLTAQRLLRN